MLAMEQIYRIRELTKNEGKSLRQTAKDTGHDFITVKKYTDKEDFNIEIRPKQQRSGKLSPYREIVTKWLLDDQNAPRKQRHTAQRVYDRLKELYPHFNASDRSVRNFVAELRNDLRIDAKGYLPLEHPPGEAQVDFGEVRFVEKGTPIDGYYLNISFPYSNAGYTQLFKSQNQECLLEGLKKIFEHIRGVPTAIWFDNMSTAVKKIKKHGERDLSNGFLRFMMHYGFLSNFCNANSGNEKGSVENKVGYHRRNLFVPVPEFDNLEAYNETLLIKLDKDMRRDHYKGIGRIEDLFLEDQAAFNKLPEVSYDVCRYEYAKADNYGKIKFGTKIYSSSPSMAGRQVMLKIKAYDVIILDMDFGMIVKHKRLYGSQKESMLWLPYLELMAKRPTALKYSGLFKELPSSLQMFLQGCDYEKKKEVLKVFSKMSYDTSMENAVQAFEEALDYGAMDADSIWATYCRLSSGSLPEMEINIPDTVPHLEKYPPNIRLYDQLMAGGGYSQ